ncbi:MAG: hypothetical protein LBN25_03395, partial [Christensenellaceae bacterium]|nr:hypothetical protein [Christensenellaceae bacterium]
MKKKILIMLMSILAIFALLVACEKAQTDEGEDGSPPGEEQTDDPNDIRGLVNVSFDLKGAVTKNGDKIFSLQADKATGLVTLPGNPNDPTYL